MEQKNYKGFLYLLPAFLFLGFFLIYPLIDVFVYSFQENYNFASQTYTGVGLYNYQYVLRDPYFLQALKNTFLLVVITVPLSTGLALLISLCLSSIQKLRDLFQTVFFLPYVTNTLAVGLVFMILFKKTAYSDGFINLLLNTLGISSVDFLSGPYWAKMLVLCLYTVWIVMPFKILILTSSLASVNEQYRSAARIDGGLPEPDLLAHHSAYDLPQPVLSHHHRLHRGLQGLFRRSGPFRHGPERRGHEHPGGLRLRHALRPLRRLPLLRLRRCHFPLCHCADYHLRQPAGKQEARTLCMRCRHGLRTN